MMLNAICTAWARLVRRTWHGRAGAIPMLWRPALLLALTGGLLAPLAGCTRAFYRKRADQEVEEVLSNKDCIEEWKIENWHVFPDPLARFAMVGDPDRPAMPPDDPAAYKLSPNPQHIPCAGIERQEGTGYLDLIAMWDQENRAKNAQEEKEEREKEEKDNNEEKKEPPKAQEGQGIQKTSAQVQTESKASGPGDAYTKPATSGSADGKTGNDTDPEDVIAEVKTRSSIDITGRPTYLLTLDQAAELAMFNSREYQDARENLYFAALPVTVQRFSFAAQFFAAEEASRAYFGRTTPNGQQSYWSLNGGTGLSKVLPTGALLLLNFSNQTVFNFLNPKNLTSVTTLDFTAFQPLLQGGGKAVALEPLTQAERSLLYQIRNFARFRKQLYVEIASNNGGSISGSTFQPSGVLSNTNPTNVSSGRLGASGITPGIPPLVTTTIGGPILAPAIPGVLFLANAITPPPTGYLSTMLQKIQVYIDQENIDVLTDILLRYRGLLEGDVVGPLQLQSVEQQLLTGRATLLSDQQQYLQSLTSFRLALGIPMALSIDMDDSLLRPLLKQFRRARSITENEHAAVTEASNLIAIEKAPRLRAELLRLFQNSRISRGTTFAGNISGRWSEWRKLSNMALEARLEELRKDAQKLLDRQAELQKQEQTLSKADRTRLSELNAQRDIGILERAVRNYEANYVDPLGRPKKPTPEGERQRVRLFQGVISAWQKVLVVARDEQWAKLRTTWPELPRCCVDGVDLIKSDLAESQAVVARHALENRFDLMNVRAQVVDAWRQIAIYANALLGVFNVGYQLSANSPVNMSQPTNIGGSGTSHQLFLNASLPIVRIEERNNYRASLIALNRQRRALQEAEDLAVQAVYNELFQLRQFAETYRVQKRLLELAYLTIDASLESLQAPTAPPPVPGLPTARTAQDGPAALTSQLLNAQRTLPTAQNALLTAWISYLDQRLQLYRDLELMPLDCRGVWIDEIKECDCGIISGPVIDTPNQPSADGDKQGATPQQLPDPKEIRDLKKVPTPSGQEEKK